MYPVTYTYESHPESTRKPQQEPVQIRLKLPSVHPPQEPRSSFTLQQRQENPQPARDHSQPKKKQPKSKKSKQKQSRSERLNNKRSKNEQQPHQRDKAPPTRIDKLVGRKRVFKRRTITNITRAIKAIDTSSVSVIKVNPKDPSKDQICDVCGLAFRRISNLKAHEMTHDKTVEKKHSCSFCSYKTHRKNDLTRHEATHARKIMRQKLKEAQVPPSDECPDNQNKAAPSSSSKHPHKRRSTVDKNNVVHPPDSAAHPPNSAAHPPNSAAHPFNSVIHSLNSVVYPPNNMFRPLIAPSPIPGRPAYRQSTVSRPTFRPLKWK